MLGKKENKKETVVVVTTKQELKAAINRKAPCIEVRGDLAKKMKWMGKLSKKKMAALALCLTGVGVVGVGVAGVATAPITAHFASLTAVEGVAASELECVIALVGTLCFIAILKGYNVELQKDGWILKLTANK